MPASLTVANSSIVITFEALYPSGVPIVGYAADNVFEGGEVSNSERSMGIDGRLAAGWVPNELPLTLTLQADSPSLEVFENVWRYENTNRTKLRVSATISLPSLGKRYVYGNGYLDTYKPPAGARILQAAVCQLVFESLNASKL
jgi:hypothetical protein